MRRDLERLRRERFDVLVVGGGIHGAAAAREAAARGLATALIERDDFGCATSANSLKIVHGGLRYLQYADLGKFREAVRARRGLLRRFPGLVAPLPCVLPTRGLGVRGRPAMAAALLLNDLLSAGRNAGVAPAGRIPRGRTVGRAELLRLAPGLDDPAATGGARWWDGIALDSERVVLGLVLDAAARGAAVANHLAATGLLAAGGAVEGVRARDGLTGAELEVRARVTVNAAGPWHGEVIGAAGAGARPFPLAKAVNVLVGRPLFGGTAVGVAGSRELRLEGRVVGRGKRFFFFVPWRGGTMIGTTYLPHEGPPADVAASARDVEEIVAEVNRIHPAARLAPEEVRFAHAGLLPVSAGGAGDVEGRLLKRPRLVDGARELGLRGLVGVVGIKYTTGMTVGAAAVDLAQRTLGERPGPRPGAPGAAAVPVAAGEAGPAAVARAVREEMALTLADLVFRRTGLGSAGHPGREALERCADEAAAELGWDAARRREELAAVEAELLRRAGRRAGEMREGMNPSPTQSAGRGA